METILTLFGTIAIVLLFSMFVIASLTVMNVITAIKDDWSMATKREKRELVRFLIAAIGVSIGSLYILIKIFIKIL